jgi:hypothetical protein
MKQLIELNKWDSKGVLRYKYSSVDMEYLEDKADKIYKVIKAINRIEDKYNVKMKYSGTNDSPEVTLHIQIEMNEKYKCKKNKDLKERDI